MKNPVLICGVAFGLFLAPLQAGSVVTLADGSDVSGKLTLTTATIHVEGSSASDLNLPDILEADFADVPFHLDCFSANNSPDQLPADWKRQDIGHPKTPGSLSYAAGTFTVTCAGAAVDRKENEDLYFFAGRQWSGDGQWTVRIPVMDPASQGAEAGLMIRDSLDAGSVMFGLGAFGLLQSKGLFHYRNTAGERSGWGGDFPLDSPAWLRLTRSGPSIDGAVSSDGKTWRNVGHYETKVSATAWVGLWVNSRNDNGAAKVMLDQVAFTPPSYSAQALPPGVWLRSGSFLAGAFNRLDFDPAHPDASGEFNRYGKNVTISSSQIAAVTLEPITQSQIKEVGSQIGIAMKNGDFLAGDFQAINGGGARLSSAVFGISSFDRSQIGACVLHPLQPQPADYEIRLRDGSIVRANSFGMTNGQTDIGEISGINVSAASEEIAQFRAGASRVQTLIDLPWKATQLPPAPAPTPPAATNTNAAPAANPAPNQTPPVECWTGPNQEQIMVVPAETIVDFPLTDKFRAMAMRVALSPDSPPGSQVTLRILANGREIARTPPFKAGDQPRFMEATLQDPKTVTVVADSLFAGTKVLFIDPVAIRENAVPTP